MVDGSDLDKAGMTALVDQFTEIAYDAEVAIVYYAGHGLQVDGRNYLVPIDAQLEKAAQLQTRTIPADKVLGALPPDPAVSIIILDACRDNPLARSLAKVLPASRSASMGVGLAPVQANGQSTGSGGLLIAYATDPGAVAYDGKGVNSPYTAALARHLTTPGLEIQSALTRVRADVSEATGGAQRPWHNASLSREVFIGGDAPAEAQVPATEVEATGNADASTDKAEVSWTVEQKLWEEASKRNTVAHYELYLQQYPSGNFTTLAKLNLDQLKSTPTTEVAAVAPAGEATASSSQIRTAVAVPDDVKLTVGTPETESALNLDKGGRVDLQLRLGALGHVTGGADGALGAKSRSAIGAWQRQNGLVRNDLPDPAAAHVPGRPDGSDDAANPGTV
ncbi:caspase family protein [Rhizobium sp. RCAM05350]|nr:caspase family protein [Rhizobium sp. RCAM05350]